MTAVATSTTSIIPAANKYLMDRIPQGMESLAIITVGRISASIDTPCPAYHDPGTGHHSPESSPPYKETGNLQAGLDHATGADGGGFWARIISRRAPSVPGGSPLVPIFLEFGTMFMAPRPYMRPVMYSSWDVIVRVFRRLFSGEAPYESGN